MAPERCTVKLNRVTVHQPLRIGGADGDEQIFLDNVDAALATHRKEIYINLHAAGGVSSTVLALCIAACRKADAVGKKITIRLHKRNATSVGLVGLDRLATVEMV